jgi:stress-induced-phosphoprotein 1
MEEDYSYKDIANSFKEKGNVAFQAGDNDLAIELYSKGIEMDPDNEIIYSNRSAAYMKADFKSKALYDAEKCVQLAPQWAKAHSRLGAAQQALKRFDNAMDSFKKGIFHRDLNYF